MVLSITAAPAPISGTSINAMDLATLDNLKQPLKEWHEVPMAKFLSWPHAMQLAYCAARDDDSALHASFEDEAIWYRKRAQSYRDELHHLI